MDTDTKKDPAGESTDQPKNGCCECPGGGFSIMRRVLFVAMLLGVVAMVAWLGRGNDARSGRACRLGQAGCGLPANQPQASARTAVPITATPDETTVPTAPTMPLATDAKAEEAATAPEKPVATDTPKESSTTGKELKSLADLNTEAAATNAVFVYLPATAPAQNTPPAAELQAAVKTAKQALGEVGIFTLATNSADHQQLSQQVKLPAVLVLVKGRGMNVVSGEITADKLVQALTVAASAGGGCGTGCGR